MMAWFVQHSLGSLHVDPVRMTSFVDGGMDLIPSFHIKEEPEASDGPDEASLLQFSSQLSMDPSQSYDFLASHVDNFLASRVGQSSSHTLGSSSLDAFSTDAYQARQVKWQMKFDLKKIILLNIEAVSTE